MSVYRAQAVAPPRVPRCPRCHLDWPVLRSVELAPSDRDGVIVERCTRCGGYLAAPVALEQLLGVPIDLPGWESARVVTPRGHSSLSCPSCASMTMSVHLVHAGPDSVLVDRCVTCRGIWLDAGELAPLVIAAQAGHQRIRSRITTVQVLGIVLEVLLCLISL